MLLVPVTFLMFLFEVAASAAYGVPRYSTVLLVDVVLAAATVICLARLVTKVYTTAWNASMREPTPATATRESVAEPQVLAKEATATSVREALPLPQRVAIVVVAAVATWTLARKK